MEVLNAPSSIGASIVALVQSKVIVPNDAAIIAALMRQGATPNELAAIQRTVQELLEAGILRLVTIGGESHLAVPSATVTNQNTVVPAVQERNDAPPETDSKLEIAIDAEAERLMLYRVALVFLVVIALLLLRQIGLAML